MLEIGTVYGTFLLSDAERRIMDALQATRFDAFLAAMGFFAAVHVVVAAQLVRLGHAEDVARVRAHRHDAKNRAIVSRSVATSSRPSSSSRPQKAALKRR